jgi:hypothetical protein
VLEGVGVLSSLIDIMPRDRAHHLLTHLTLALAGICLSIAEITYLPEIFLVLPIYLGLIAISWRRGQRKALPAWLGNVLALLVTLAAVAWMLVRSNTFEDTWSRDVPLPVLLIPHLGSVLMVLSLLRLFRPPSTVDFWVLQGLAVLQVALGCVLASGYLFGASLLAYLVVAGCAVACHERLVQGRPAPGEVVSDGQAATNGATATQPVGALRMRESSWLSFGLRWTPAVALFVGILFALTPRIEGPEWDPLARFGVHPPKIRMQVGFSDEVDLTRVGRVERDASPAFTVRVVDRDGRPSRGFQETQRFRGMVLDQYTDGRWKRNTDLRGLRGPPPRSTLPLVIDRADVLSVSFQIPRETGGLFLAEPVLQGANPRMIPVVLDDSLSTQQLPLFFEAAGSGTVVTPPLLFSEPEYRYTQTFLAAASRERYPAVRVSAAYQAHLIRAHKENLLAWMIEVLRKIDRQQFPEAEQLLGALERFQTRGFDVPSMYWEPIARLLTHYLSRSGEFAWSPEVRRQDMRRDPVTDFLFDVKEGPCDRFASALTFILRALKIPARIVIGFRGAEYKGDGTYVVYNNYAHAWVEAIVPSQSGTGTSYDWLILDPTPPEAAPTASALERLQRSSQAFWRDLFLGVGVGDQFDLWDELMSGRLVNSLAPWLGVPAMLGTLLWTLRRRRQRRRKAKGKSGSLYEQMLGLLARHVQIEPAPSETPVEIADRAAALLSQRPATRPLADVPARVVALYYSVRFGGQAPDKAMLRESASRLDELERALRKA